MRTGPHAAAADNDDRQVLALLMLPVLLLGLAIGVGQTLRHRAVLPPMIAHAPAIQPTPAPRRVAVETPRRAPLVAPPKAFSLPGDALAIPPPHVDVAAKIDPALPAAAPVIAGDVSVPTALPPLPADLGPAIAAATEPLTEAMTGPTAGLPTEPLKGVATTLSQSAPDLPRETVALAVPDLRPSPGEPSPLPLPGPNDTASAAVEMGANVCVPETPPPRVRPVSWTNGRSLAADPVRFGIDLAEAAKTQTREFVIYNDKYRRIPYPMGDVPSFYGVCTDVLIRAYRDLGIDLQEFVQTTRVGSGDRNIDHRRVNTLRRFFSLHGEQLPITDFAENFRPGDIVSYWRPQNRHSRTHIAIVANEIGPSGRPMIIHNRGWGPQIEDALFVDQITGHYRFHGLATRAKGRPEANAGALRAGEGQSTARREAGTKPASATR